MGRLVPQKGFDRLIPAFATVSSSRPGWRLTIWGEGPDRPALELLRDSVGIAHRVALPGMTDDPGTALASATLFVLSSRWEGFPTVLGEAMALGVPVVSVDCPSGPADIVRDGIDGILVAPDDAAALADGLARLMDDGAVRANLASRAPEVLERFGLAHVLALWEDVFREVGMSTGAGPGDAVGAKVRA